MSKLSERMAAQTLLASQIARALKTAHGKGASVDEVSAVAVEAITEFQGTFSSE